MPTHCRRCCSRNAEWNCLNVYSQTLCNKQLVYRWAFPLQKFFQMFIFKDESKHLLASSSLPSHVMCLPGISLTRLTSMIELQSVTCLNTDCGKTNEYLFRIPVRGDFIILSWLCLRRWSIVTNRRRLKICHHSTKCLSARWPPVVLAPHSGISTDPQRWDALRDLEVYSPVGTCYI